MLIFKLY